MEDGVCLAQVIWVIIGFLGGEVVPIIHYEACETDGR